MFQDGDVILTGLFPVHYRVIEPDLSFSLKPEAPHCEGFDFRAFRWLQTMVFAIDEINRDGELLPGVKLGFQIFDTCGTHSQALRSAITSASGEEETFAGESCAENSSVPIIIGDSGSTQSMIILRTLAPFQIPMVSYFASCSCLSNREEFPAFFRTIPSDTFQARAVVRLVQRFGWTWVGSVAGDDDYGRYGTQAFTDEVKKLGVCIAFTELIPKVYSRERILQITETIKRSTARVIVMFALEGDAYPLIKEVVQQNITGHQWIASEAWVTSSLMATVEHLPVLDGTIGFAIPRAEIPGLRDFLLQVDPFKSPENGLVKELWETMFKCWLSKQAGIEKHNASVLRYQPCTGSEDLSKTDSIYLDVSELRVSYNVYKAVYAIAHSLHNLKSCVSSGEILPDNSCAKISNFSAWQLLHYLHRLRYNSTSAGDMTFDSNGNPAALYDIINWQRQSDGSIRYVQVGRFDADGGLGQDLLINQEAIIWHNNQKQVPQSACTEPCTPGSRQAARNGEPVCCYDCLLCPDGEISNRTNSLNCIPCPEDSWSNLQRNKCIPKELEFLSFAEPLGLMLTTGSALGALSTIIVAAVLLYHRDTPIVRANNSKLSFLLLFSLTFCFLCSLTYMGQPSTWTCMLRHTLFGVSFVLCISCVLGKTLVVLIAFKATLPNSNVWKWLGTLQQVLSVFSCTLIQVIICVVWLLVSPPSAARNVEYSSEKILLECNLGSVSAFCCVLGYIGFLSCMSFVLAFLARKLPDQFNEAKLITFSMLVFGAVWLAFIPAYVSSPGKYTVAVEIFAILSSSFALLICIFAPKCYVILLKPHKNTRKHLMDKTCPQKSS
ncbi:extracellular calcium-sensing receptor-like [Callorhinchus milii]|uniref:extracellular calcium-sensing receptor-like n=1 Tax=Callorhinchus milii TaxID=7868 RepID=UPI001C3FEA03|nr:extracellular calcium-sensing receptor-like [Callorhinchus milii]